MCIQVVRKVIKISDDTAELDDGRIVRIGFLKSVKVGDTLEVYGDVAITKLNENNENNESNKVISNP